MPGPLDGFRVIDLTTMIAGPLATMHLGDQGADVIKVEARAGGDFTRGTHHQNANMSAIFLNNNRNKRSITIDLKSAEGVEVFRRLGETSDVIVQNFRPGVVDRLGIGYEDIKKLNPKIIYMSMSGFGEEGPYADKPVYDPLIQALSGLASVQGGSDEVRPRLVRTILPDKLTGLTATQAVTAALLARERTGEGQHIKLSMLASVIAFLWPSDMGGQTFIDKTVEQSRAASFRDLIYETSDGYMSVSIMQNKHWAALCNAFDKPEWLEDERFKTPGLRDLNANDRLDLTQSVLITRTTDEWLEMLDKAGIPCAPVLTRSQMINHPQILANDVLVETVHPVAGNLRQARVPAQFSATPVDDPRGAPLLGEQTDEILADIGYSADQISEMRAGGIAGD